MLTAAHRLRARRDFRGVYRAGRVRRGQLMWLYTKPNQLSVTRVGIVVPNKVVKTAVGRNRRKRQLRSVARKLLPDLSPGYDLIIVAQPPASQTSHQALLLELTTLLQQAGLLPAALTDQPSPVA